MTGYGKAVSETENFELSLEIKSVNNRYLDMTFKMPVSFLEFEMSLREIVKEKLKRGSINVYLNISKKPNSLAKKFNTQAILSISSELKKISELARLQTPTWSDILKFDEIYEKASEKDEDIASTLQTVFNNAIDELIQFRKAEGEKLSIAIKDYLKRIVEISQILEKEKESATKIQFERLKERIEVGQGNLKVDEERLVQELAIISDKVDITEEVIRMKSHIDQFDEILGNEYPAGQKLNFLTQEMHREANTISSKTNLTLISRLSVELKELIEKIREQVQNIE